MSEQEYDNTNRGAMFVNSYKEEGDNRPDFTGQIDVEGTEYKIAGWKRTSEKKGTRFISLSIDKKEEKEDAPF